MTNTRGGYFKKVPGTGPDTRRTVSIDYDTEIKKIAESQPNGTPYSVIIGARKLLGIPIPADWEEKGALQAVRPYAKAAEATLAKRAGLLPDEAKWSPLIDSSWGDITGATTNIYNQYIRARDTPIPRGGALLEDSYREQIMRGMDRYGEEAYKFPEKFKGQTQTILIRTLTKLRRRGDITPAKFEQLDKKGQDLRERKMAITDFKKKLERGYKQRVMGLVVNAESLAKLKDNYNQSIRAYKDEIQNLPIRKGPGVKESGRESGVFQEHPLVPAQFVWPEKKLKSQVKHRDTGGDILPSFSMDFLLAGSTGDKRRCDMCGKLGSECGKLFQQGLYDLCHSCCTSPKQKSDLRQGISIFSPEDRKQITSQVSWKMMFGGSG